MLCYILIQWRFTHIAQSCLAGNQATEVTLRYMGKRNSVKTKTFQYRIRCVIVRSHKVTKVRDLESSNCCEIWKKSWVTLLSCGLMNQKRYEQFNSLWPSDVLWRHSWYGSTLAQATACSHYTNQHWFSISEVLWYSHESNIIVGALATNLHNHFNTLRPRQNGRHFADDICKCIFLNEND